MGVFSYNSYEKQPIEILPTPNGQYFAYSSVSVNALPSWGESNFDRKTATLPPSSSVISSSRSI